MPAGHVVPVELAQQVDPLEHRLVRGPRNTRSTAPAETESGTSRVTSTRTAGNWRRPAVAGHRDCRCADADAGDRRQRDAQGRDIGDVRRLQQDLDAVRRRRPGRRVQRHADHPAASRVSVAVPPAPSIASPRRSARALRFPRSGGARSPSRDRAAPATASPSAFASHSSQAGGDGSVKCGGRRAPMQSIPTRTSSAGRASGSGRRGGTRCRSRTAADRPPCAPG